MTGLNALADKLEKPQLSPNFSMEDIWKLRKYNSQRYMTMTFEEIKADIRADAEKMQARIEQIRANLKKEPTT